MGRGHAENIKLLRLFSFGLASLTQNEEVVLQAA